MITKNGAHVVRKVKRVRYYRRSTSGTRSVRRYHIVRHTKHSNVKPTVTRTRVGDKIVSKPIVASPDPVTGAIELPRDIVTPLIIRGMDNLQAGKRYVEITEQDGKLIIKESGEIDPNGQFLEVIEEDGVWKIKGTDIVVDYARTFDVSKVPPAVKAYLKPSTDFISPDGTYVQYKEGANEVIPIQADTIPPLVNPGDYVELHQMAADGEYTPGTWETYEVPAGIAQGGSGSVEELIPVGGVATGGTGMTGGPGIPVTGIPIGPGGPGVPVTGVPVGPGGPGVPITGVPVGTGISESEGPRFPGGVAKGPGIGGIPETDTPAAGMVPPGAPMKAAADDQAPLPATAAKEEPPKSGPPVPPIVPGEETTPPAAGIPAPGFPMASSPDKPSGIVPFTDVGKVPPPRGGGPGWHMPGMPPIGGLLPAALGAAALGGAVALPLALMGGGNGGGGNPGFYPPVGTPGSPVVGGGAPGISPVPQPTASLPPATTSPTCYPGPGTGPVCPPTPTTPPCTPPTTPPCTPPAPPSCPPPPCGPPPPCTPPPCPPPPCGPPPPCLPPPCPPPPCTGGYIPGCYPPGPVCGPVLPGCGPVLPGCGPVPPGCDPGYGGGYGCDNGYGNGYGCDNGGYGGGFGGNPCMTNASKFGQGQSDGCATGFKQKWWSERGRKYCYDDPCAAQQAGCAASMGGCTTGMGGMGMGGNPGMGLGNSLGLGSALGGGACPPMPCDPPPVCPPY